MPTQPHTSDMAEVVGFVTRDYSANCEAYWCVHCVAPKGAPLGADAVSRGQIVTGALEVFCGSCGEELR